MEISISKRDIYWNYIAQFFNLGSGFIILPVVLHMLSTDEVGMNYLMLSVSSLVALADFGFSSQFGRNITYVFSGAQELKKEGLSLLPNGEINYHLLAVVIETAKYIYRKISVIVLFFMLTAGSIYMYKATNGFTLVHYSLLIWLLFSVSTFFNMYFMYYDSLLTGAAMIMESKKAMMLNRISYISISFALLFAGCGLISIVVASFISPFVGRWYSHRQFYREEMRLKLSAEIPQKEEVKNTFNILWYNAKKLGINFLGAYGVQQSGTFIIGLFLPLSDVASYGLMCQLFQVSIALTIGVFTTFLPVFYKERVEKNMEKIVKDFCFCSFIFIVGFTILGLGIILFGHYILLFIGSATKLPIMVVMIVYFVHLLLENFHSMCATMIVSNNQVPFVKASIISGVFIVLFNLASLGLTTLGLLGVVLGQLIVQSLYNHWKWPLWIFREMNLNPVRLMNIGLSEVCSHIKRYNN